MPRPGREPATRPAGRGARRRRLRHRRGPCGPHRGARGGAARLVGGGAGGAERRLERLGPQHRLRAAGLCGVRAARWSTRVGARARQEALEAVGGGRRICPRGPRGRPMPGVRSHRRRLAACRQDRRRPRDAAEAELLAGQIRRARSNSWPADQVREELRSPLYFNGLHYPRGFSIHSLNYALGLAAAAEARRRAHLREHRGAGDRSGRRAKARHDQGRARARTSRRARGQRPSRQPDAAVRQDAAAGAHLCHRHCAARQGAARGRALPRRGERHRPCRQPLLRGRGRPADVVGPQHGVARQAAGLRRDAARPDQAHLPAAQEREGRIRLDRARSATPCIDAADRRDHARPVASVRLRQSRAQHHGDGRRDRCARHRRGRPHLAECSRRSRWCGPAGSRPRGAAGVLLVVAARELVDGRHGAAPRGASASARRTNRAFPRRRPRRLLAGTAPTPEPSPATRPGRPACAREPA